MQTIWFVVLHYLRATAHVYLGDIMYYEIFGQRFVVLGSFKQTNELLGKRSPIYSGRQVPPFLEKM